MNKYNCPALIAAGISLIICCNNRATAQTTTTESFDGTTFPPTGWVRSSATAITRETTNTSGFPTASPNSGAGMADMATSGATTSGTFYTLASKSADLTNACTSCSPGFSFYIFKDSRWASTAAGASIGSAPVNNYVEVYINTTQDLTGFPYLLDRVNTRTDMYPIASNGWYKNTYSIPAKYFGQTVYFILKCYYSGNDGDDVLIDDVSYTEFSAAPGSMTYTSCTTTQSGTTTTPGSYNQQVIGVQVVSSGCASALSVSSMAFNTTGDAATTPADVTNARVWYTGTSNAFATTTQFGTTIASPSGSFTVAGSQALSAGTNYFWLTYDINPDATYTDVIDGKCTSVTVGGTIQTPTQQSPVGSTTISDFTYCSPSFSSGCAADYLTSVTLKQGGSTLFTNTTSAPGTCTSGLQASTAALTTGTTYTLNLASVDNKVFGGATAYYMAWIDYNRDGAFSSSELITSGSVAIGSGVSGTTTTTSTPTFALPACFIPGKTRMRVVYEKGTTGASTLFCTALTSGEYLDYTITLSGAASSSFSSVSATQASSASVAPSLTNQQMVEVQVNTTCAATPVSITSFTFNTAGSSAVSDISNAKLWYTASSSAFSTAKLFGEVLNPSGTYTITGSQKLAGNTSYYFWLTYDIASAATIGDVVDAQCTSVTVGGVAQTVSSPPTASREVDINMGNGVFYACSGKLYDSGGSGASNSPPECYAVVLYPTAGGNNANITFQNWSLKGQADVINIYNGVGTSGTLLQTFNGNTAAYPPATAISATGCNGYGVITVEYLSGSSSAGTSDWAATMSCSSTSTLTWQGTTTNWQTAANWSPNKVPTPCYDVVIPNIATQPIVGTAQQDSCRSITINSGATLTVQSTSGALNIYGNITNNGTINYTSTSTSASQFLQMYSTGGTISGSGTYSSLPIFFNALSGYTISGNAAFTYFYIYNGATVTHTNNTVTIAKTITQSGTWNLGSSTVNFSGDDGMATAPNYPDIKSSLFNAGTSTFNYSSTANKQYVTAAVYYNLQVNNNSSYTVPVGYYTANSALSTTCHNFTVLLGTPLTTGYVNLYFPITVTGDLYIRGGCVFDINNHSSGTVSLTTDNSITLTGNWTNDGTFINGNGNNFAGITNPRTVIFNGSSLQTISGLGSTTFYNLSLNKSAGNTQLNGIGATVANQLSLNSNILDLNTQTLTLSNNSTSSITRTSGYVLSEDPNVNAKINWNISTTNGSYIYPFGYNGTYIPFTFQLTNGGNAGYVSVATYHPTGASNTPYPPTVTHLKDTTAAGANNSANTVSRYWQINKAGAAGMANITFTYVNSEQPANGEDSLRAQRWNGTKWLKWYSGTSSQISNSVTNTVTANGVTSFSPWTLSRRLHPLPITLLSFTATPKNENIDLNWQTATEVNNAMFTVERSRDAIVFEKVTDVKGAGNSNSLNNYYSIDYSPYHGISYYRLKQTDFNDIYTYSDIKQVNVLPKAGLVIMPNPVNTNVATLVVNTSLADQATVRVYDEMGKIIFQGEQSYQLNKGINQIELNTNDYKPGIYLVKINTNNADINARFIKL